VKSSESGSLGPPSGSESPGAALITGGVGFVGTNLALRLMREGHDVIVLDNLARPGVRKNLAALQSLGRPFRLIEADVRDRSTVLDAVREAGVVFHFAAQASVTQSLANPRNDFDVNAGGTLNVLEAVRQSPRRPPVILTSTNKVYGALEDVTLRRHEKRYRPADRALEALGIDERRHLNFRSPYGCSKGAADQYVVDYVRTFGLLGIVFRMSCIYGPHQQGNEDQGWVAHFMVRARSRLPITIFGDGLQVRDVLSVDDLVDALILARAHLPKLSGRVFNVGGGPDRTLSLLELVDILGSMYDGTPRTVFDSVRPGDQKWYVSNTSAFAEATGWAPNHTVEQGLLLLANWLEGASEGVVAPNNHI
jgi:CDP-paratose 2-epimerase